MAKSIRVLAFAATLCFSVAFAAASSQFLPSDWSQHPTDVPTEDDHMTVTIGLKQRNLDLLLDTFNKVSDPSSPYYSKYLSIEQIADLVAPSQSDINKVIGWLRSEGAYNIDLGRSRDFVRCRFSAVDVNRAFKVNLSWLVHKSGSRRIMRSPVAPTLPHDVARLVDVVHGISNIPPPMRKRDLLAAPAPSNFNAKGAAPGSVVGLTAMSRGSQNVTVAFSIVCPDGKVASSVPPCPGTPLLAVNVVSAPVLDTSVHPADILALQPTCAVTNGVASCSASFRSVYYDPRRVSVALHFSSGEGPISSWDFPVVSTPPVTPQTINAQYSIPASARSSLGSQAVVEFEDQYASFTDYDLFLDEMGITSAPPVKVVGFNNVSDPGVEANLDLQYIVGVAPGVPTTLWNIYANSTVEIDNILEWAYQMGNDTDPPLVNSLSYGMTEDLVDKYQGAGYLARSDVEFQKLAVRGITIIIADGDTGAGDLGAPPMSEPTCNTLHADWPSQSPYVTAIGSTYLTPNAEPICYLSASSGGIDCEQQPLGETATSMENGLFWGTGGGFSRFSSRPSYQEAAVSAFMARNSSHDVLPPSNMFASGGRAYPDAVTVGHNLIVAYEGSFIPVDGTSASAPIFAGVISLLNAARLNAGKAPLGFLNPLMYSAAANVTGSFYDVTVGSNRCGAVGFTPQCCSHAYHAAPGWDAVTGLGSPNFAVLREAALSV